MGTYRIGEIATLADVPASTIRYYERIGLLPTPARVNGNRRYDKAILDTLAVIKLTKTMGLSIEEIDVLINQQRTTQSPSERWQTLAPTKLIELQQQIRALKAQQVFWQQTQHCTCSTLIECAKDQSNIVIES